MNEDKLTAKERRRLESFAQAVQASFALPAKHDNKRPTLDDLFAHAERIESWLAASNGN